MNAAHIARTIGVQIDIPQKQLQEKYDFLVHRLRVLRTKVAALIDQLREERVLAVSSKQSFQESLSALKRQLQSYQITLEGHEASITLLFLARMGAEEQNKMNSVLEKSVHVLADFKHDILDIEEDLMDQCRAHTLSKRRYKRERSSSPSFDESLEKAFTTFSM